MKLKSIILITILSISFLNANETPTERYLIENPIEQIENHFRNEYLGEEFKSHQPFFQKVIEREKEGNVFGYHASTQNFRIFQDILRAVFEEIFNYQIPEDFHFLRVPGGEEFDFPEGKDSFFQLFGRDKSPDALDLMVDTFLFVPFKQQFGHQLSIEDFTFEEQEAFRQIFLEFADYLDSLESPLFQIDFGSLAIPTVIPTLNCIPKTNDSPEMSAHKMEVAKKLQDLLNKDSVAASIKTLAFPKFHPDAYKYSQFIRKSLEHHHIDLSNKKIQNWLESQLKPKQLIMTFWNLGYNSSLSEDEYALIEVFIMPFLDTRVEQQKRLICMNIPLYGNYFRWDESSVSIFLGDASIEGGDRHVKKALKAFFKDIGLDTKLVNLLFEDAKTLMRNDPGSSHGCLYQFFDQDQEFPYMETDTSAYVSFDFGVPSYEISPSDILAGSHPIKGKHVDLQLRLIMSNQSVLNPYGQLRIVRYDEVSEKVAEKIMQSIKSRIKNEDKDPEKIRAYQNKLEALWSQPRSDFSLR